MNASMHGGEPYDPSPRPRSFPPGGPTPVPTTPPGTVPTDEPVEACDLPASASDERLGLDVRRYWAGAVVTVVVCGLIGLAASVIFDQAFDVGLLDVVGGSSSLAWAMTGALFGLLAAVVLQVLVMVAPRPRMFFGWLVAVVTVILAVTPFTGNPDAVPAVVTALVWIVLGLATSSMLSGVLGRTLVRPTAPPT
ncbi:hypothetical protein LEP48_15760 [Isoptericola sp. NEAU-Y5]|uniref:Uncharacterized protein n=1 Tax=Isoptericola luteus TaxID=2879484 RepID=A0ABS7ZIE5_9MICO|nr:hypothetical protein [Isoptericola sp. NEAU-Y5]MCA5894796.1 hypothetical protein [Isoptericola sp. NEAU-Y5]